MLRTSIDAAEPTAAPPLLVQALSAHPDFLSLGGPDLDLRQTLVLHEIAADLDLYILPYRDRSQSCMYIFDRPQSSDNMHGGCSGVIHPTGHVVVIPGDFYDKLEIDRGELCLTD